MYSDLQYQANARFNMSFTYLNISNPVCTEIIYINNNVNSNVNIQLNMNHITSIIPDNYATLGSVFPIKVPGIFYNMSFIKQDVILANINSSLNVFVPGSNSNIYLVNASFPYSAISINYPVN